MTTENSNPAYDTARGMYLSWVDASLDANERFARVARAWIDESLGAQQDMADLLRKAFTETERTATRDDEQPAPFTLIGRFGDIGRVNYELWTEAGLKAQERISRFVQTAFTELQSAQTSFASTTEKALAGANRTARK
jgi:hypothetical protein